MTPQERQMIDDLFSRLAALENAPRDAEAERAIIDGLRRAPNAAYALVQTVLLQDEALKRANAHIEELEAHARGQAAPASGSFLDSMRDAVFGGGSHGSVPNVRAPEPAQRPVWNSGSVLGGNDPRYGGGYAPQGGYGAPQGGYGYGAPQGGGSSFLGNAAAAAVGVIGGSMLMNGIRGLMGGHQAFSNAPGLVNDSSRPWGGGSDLSNSDLARDAGINDIGSAPNRFADDSGQQQGLFDNASNDDYDDDGFDNDAGGDDGGSDYA